ncbi:hypothetical protein FOA43_001234 [Brettanomyces nanus]|uniref:t-SNARE coiled-coil homology domain-containing protein n=1 Tax=Eeniella nana TaxID=13502 RepID=A0A875S258_EENNA|nr:uncharacterized protein FOA43_001234 [Brettanomyces nanus]QPG73919.1 hypothetical protein FOA43_001234 [Brettanomyces nanus]
MGLKKLFRPPKDMTREQEQEYLQNNGVMIKNESNYHRRKFKFGEFAKFTKEKAQDIEPLKPRDRSRDAREQAARDDGYGGGTYSAPSTSYRQRNTYTDGHATQSAPTSKENGYGTSSSGSGSGSYQPVSQSSYGLYAEGKSGQTYDPYAQQNQHKDSNSGVDAAGVVGGVTSLQVQKQAEQQQQEQHYDPYAQEAETQTIETDFNRYPNAGQGQGQDQYYNPALEPQQEQEEEQEVDLEEEEVNRIMRQTKDVREATVKSSGNILRNLKEADDSATNTMGTLGAQHEKMYEMEKNMNLMDTQQRFLQDHVKELEHYNRGLFHIKAGNPFTRKSRKKAAEKRFLMDRQADRQRESQLNGKLYSSQQAIIGQMKDDDGRDAEVVDSDLKTREDYQRRVQAASKYLTEEHDEEDEKMEVEFGRNMDEAQKMAKNLHSKANVIAQEISSQNKGLQEISEKVNRVDDKMVVTTNRIRGI